MHTSALPFFGLIRVSGEDRTSFLHSQLSNHIEGLAEGEACYATYNTPKGRVIANMLVFNRGEDLLLLTAADLVEALCKRLRMFVLRAKAVFEPLPGYGAAGRLKIPVRAERRRNRPARRRTAPFLPVCRFRRPHRMYPAPRRHPAGRRKRQTARL